MQKSSRVPDTCISGAQGMGDRGKLAPLTALSRFTENINSRLLQSGPQGLGSSCGGQEAFQCVHHRVTA